MPIQVKDLSKAVRSVTVHFQGDTVLIQYRAGANTAASAISLQERMEDEEASATEMIVERLSELIESWDLMDGDKPYALTKENILALPIPLINAILEAIVNEQSPNSQTRRRSRR